MGKKQHSKDRMYLTTTEWKEEWGGYKDRTATIKNRLPFHCCGISFTPFEDPVCTDDGTCFDIINIVPYIQKYGKHPVTGAPLQLKDLTKLEFHKNADNEYICPVMGKVFTEHTHIVAVKTTGNVYCWEALEELCIKPKNWKDLITDEPFTRKDIIHIQDPLNLQGKAVESFDHVAKQLTVDVGEPEPAPGDEIRNANDDLKRALTALKTTEAKDAFSKGGGGRRAEAARILAEAKAAASTQSKTKEGSAKPAAAQAGKDWRLQAPTREDKEVKWKPGALTWDTDEPLDNTRPGKKGTAGSTVAAGSSGSTPQQIYEKHVKYVPSAESTGAMSRAFTSSVAPLTVKNQMKMIRLDRNPTKKGYIRMHTNLGDLNIELHCDIVPRTCENFLALCDMKYYDNTIFHRSIKNFMIQGGDPTGTGTGGESIYGKKFKDELDSRLVHAGRGIVSMANSGPGTNGSQFFITYKSARHLDFKHSVFGKVVGGFDVLSAMEKVPTNADDRPLQELKITGVTIFTNPYKEMEEAEALSDAAKSKQEEEEKYEQDREQLEVGTWFSAPSHTNALAAQHGGVGKYLSQAVLSTDLGGTMPASREAAKNPGDAPALPAAKKARPSSQLSNFDAW